MLQDLLPTFTVFMGTKNIKAVAISAIQINERTATGIELGVITVPVSFQVLFQGFVLNVINLAKESDAAFTDLSDHTFRDLSFLKAFFKDEKSLRQPFLSPFVFNLPLDVLLTSSNCPDITFRCLRQILFVLRTALTDGILGAVLLNKELRRPSTANGIPIPKAVGIRVIPVSLTVLVVANAAVISGVIVECLERLLKGQVLICLHFLGFLGSFFVTKLTGFLLINLSVANAEFAMP